MPRLHPFPESSLMRWRRLDVPGHEEARVESVDGMWRLSGRLDVEEAGVVASLSYTIECGADWCTRTALIEGISNGDRIRIALAADGAGRWWRDDVPVRELDGALDVDLGFTPATNTLPIRRLALDVDESAAVRSAWVRFPELRLMPLDQTYSRESDRRYRYGAMIDGEEFTAALETDAFGRVLLYEGLWVAE